MAKPKSGGVILTKGERTTILYMNEARQQQQQLYKLRSGDEDTESRMQKHKEYWNQSRRLAILTRRLDGRIDSLIEELQIMVNSHALRP
ncbi:MAG: hypothetical protein ACREBU_18675, partial [Nitrososphaera sp.]